MYNQFTDLHFRLLPANQLQPSKERADQENIAIQKISLIKSRLFGSLRLHFKRNIFASRISRLLWQPVKTPPPSIPTLQFHFQFQIQIQIQPHPRSQIPWKHSRTQVHPTRTTIKWFIKNDRAWIELRAGVRVEFSVLRLGPEVWIRSGIVVGYIEEMSVRARR